MKIQNKKIEQLDLKVLIGDGVFTPLEEIRPDYRTYNGQYFLQIQSKINEIVSKLNERKKEK